MNKFILAPSVIASDFTHLADEITACESAAADWLHVDIMDGHFVLVKACRRTTKLPLDVHLMISEPEKYIEAFAKAGASNITVHVEACDDLSSIVKQIKSTGCTAGITLKPSTPASALDSALSSADLVLVMSVEPGFSGQAFMPEMIGKVQELRHKLDALHSSANLEVDGGINAETLPLMKQAGANAFVAGNAVFKHPQGTSAGVKELRKTFMA